MGGGGEMTITKHQKLLKKLSTIPTAQLKELMPLLFVDYRPGAGTVLQGAMDVLEKREPDYFVRFLDDLLTYVPKRAACE